MTKNHAHTLVTLSRWRPWAFHAFHAATWWMHTLSARCICSSIRILVS